MDFAFNEDQLAIRGLAKQILGDLITEPSLRALDGKAERHERAWSALAEVGVFGVVVPEAFGGMGFGAIEMALILQQVGRTVAPIPAWGTLVSAAVLGKHGTESLKQRWLFDIATGESAFTLSLVDAGSRLLALPATKARIDDDVVVVNGERIAVPDASICDAFLCPVATKQGTRIAVIPLKTGGVTLTDTVTTDDRVASNIVLDDVRIPIDHLLPLAAVESLAQWSAVGLCALQLGIAETALRMTAEYATSRKQFGQPIGQFQAVSQRAADAYINTRAMDVALWNAAWRVDNSASAAREVSIAKYMAAECGHAVAAAAQHIHGGMGFDRDYPLYRYFLAAKQVEFSLGGAQHFLQALGELIASRATPAEAEL